MALPPSRRATTTVARTGLAAETQANALVATALKNIKANREGPALRALTQALQLDPLNIQALRWQAQLLAKHEKFTPAIELMQTALLQDPDDAEGYFLLARWLSKTGFRRLAAVAMHRCVQLRPNQDAPRRYLAGLYGSMGFEDHSQFWAKKAIRSNSLQRRDAKKDVKLTVLALFTQASGSLKVNRNTFGLHTEEGHNNLTGLLDSDHITVIRFYVDTIEQQPELLRKLPAADVIYNSITDPERCEHALKLAQKVCDRLNLPVINQPNAVLAASREGNYARFKDNATVILPKSVKLESVQGSTHGLLSHAMQEHGFTLPVIVRLAGFQGGKYMHKVDDLDSHDFTELDAELTKQPQTLYVIQYHDVSYTDERLPDTTLYPKYRAFMVGGTLYPVHLFIAPNDFNVHLKNSAALAQRNEWLIDKEKNYCIDPSIHFGGEMWRELESTVASLGIDYVGVDFAPATAPGNEGRAVVFESNASMRNGLLELPERPHTQNSWRVITEAAHTFFANNANVVPWAFQLPKGQQLESTVVPEEVLWQEKEPLPDHATSNQRWLAERLGVANDFSDAPFFKSHHYIDEEVLEHTALQQDIRVQRHPGRMLEFTHNDQQVVFHINAPRIPMDVMKFGADKVLLKSLFTANGIPTPEGQAFTAFEPAYRYFASCTRPQVVKPTNGFGSRGVSVNIVTTEQFQAAWEKARKIGTTVLVEDMIQGEELRVYFIGGKFVAASARTAAFVVGDGEHSIAELMSAKNQQRAQNPATAKALIHETPALNRAGRQRDDVPAAGEWVVLGDSHVTIEGAEYIALGEALPAPVIATCQKAASLLPSAVCGVDLFIEDLAQPERLWVTEVNASTPAISGLFHFPRYGQPTNVASQLLDHAFTHCAQPVQPGTVTITPAKPCSAIRQAGASFATDHLQKLACALNLPVQRPTEDALLLGHPTQLGWTQHMSTHTAMESTQVLKHKEWLGQRLQAFGVAKPALKQATDVRLLVAGEQLLAAHAKTGEQWKDITETLHAGVADIAGRIMHALYRPGHALITLTMTHPAHDPATHAWGIKLINLQPELAMFYTGIDQPRDVLSALLAVWLPNLTNTVVTPVSQRLHITGKVQGVGYRQWLKQEAARHALEASICNLPNGSVEAVVHGQPNAIAALATRCAQGPEKAAVSEVIVNEWAGEIPKGIAITDTPALV